MQSITTTQGTTLTASDDVKLAWAWAEHASGDRWARLNYGQQCHLAADALAELRRAADRTPPMNRAFR
jgi:hypothetical protein